jgi:ribulose-5-phosphate 4-epimerase/fuculose-1-phosphate aldolase
MNNILKGRFTDFVSAAHRIAENGLVVCGSGNLSWRVDDDHMLVTTAGSWMASISADEVAVCRIADGVTLDGKKPSKEIGFHTAILRERGDVNVVLHFQSPSATTLACQEPQVKNFFVIPEIPYYIGPVALVPYLLPGSPQLAEAVTAAIKEHNLANLRNHGQVTVGRDFDEVIEKATYFELACKIILGAGDKVQFLSRESVADLRRMGDASRKRRYT